MTHTHTTVTKGKPKEPDPWGCVAASAEKKWFVVCDCQTLEGCKHCKEGKIYPERCPEFYLDEETTLFRTLYNEYENRGTLPYPGSLIEQPRVLFLYFDYFRSFTNTHLAFHRKAEEENAKASEILGRGTKGNGKRR